MPGPTPQGALPPDVPEEYGAAYRTAYEQALRDLEAPQAPLEAAAEQEALQPAPIPGAHAGAPTEEETRTEYRTRTRWVIPLAFAAGALILIAAAYFVGRMISGSDSEPNSAPSPTTSVQQSPSKSSSKSSGPTTSPTPTPEASAPPAMSAWKGAVAPIALSTVKAGCTAKPGVDSSGARVTYGAKRSIDKDPSTSWRCDGEAFGQKLRIAVPAGTRLAEVGLIPGYAKTDEKSGVDRYAENNRITRVRWILADGTQVEQTLSANPKDRSLRTMRIPATATDSVTLEILAVAKGKRNTTMISELSLKAAS